MNTRLAVPTSQPLHCTPGPFSFFRSDRLEHPKREGAANEGESEVANLGGRGGCPANKLVEMMRLESFSIQAESIVEGDRSSSSNLLNCDIVGLAVALEFNSKIWACNNLLYIRDVLDLRSPVLVEASKRQPLRAVQPDIPAPINPTLVIFDNLTQVIRRVRYKGRIHQALDTELAIFGDVVSAPWTLQKVFLCKVRILVFAEFLPHHLCVFIRNYLEFPIACAHPDGSVAEALMV